MPYQWIIFDADNTLFDYDQAERQALNNTLHLHGFQATTCIHQKYKQINANLWTLFEQGKISSGDLRIQRFKELASAMGLSYDTKIISQQYLLNLGKEAGLLDGARKVLDKVSKHYQLVLATNGIADVQRRRLARSKLGDYFQAVVISDIIGVSKPSPAFFEEVFHQIGNPPKRTVLMVGDSFSSDIVGGINFGIHTCWLNPNGSDTPSSMKPTYQISNLTALLPLLRGNHML